jgi:hypothetical protein
MAETGVLAPAAVMQDILDLGEIDRGFDHVGSS